jgi:L-serine kinase (ATP) / ParB family transcriptional regulator, heme-responsive regulator
MRDSTELPDLRMLPTASLATHEDCDPRRVERLSQHIRQEGLFKHPPIVAEIPSSDKFVVLDGANRTTAVQSLGMPHLVAQLVLYEEPHVILDTWYHVVAGMPLDDFEHALTQVTGLHLEEVSLEEARQALAVNEAGAYIICESGVRIACNTHRPCAPDPRLLTNIVSAYRGRADIFRASNDIWEIQKPYYPGITALVVFPRLRPQDVIEAARSGVKIPTGITRHIISPRALNINVPLWILAVDWPLEQKEQWLRDWMMDRMLANAIRYYSESTFTFNEY